MELIYALALMITGVAAGSASGMLGVGGCFIMVPVQFWVLTSSGVEPTLATRISFGTALAVALPTAANAARSHRQRGAVDLRAAILLGGAGLVGAFIGGVAAAHAPGTLLRIVFGVVIIGAASRMLVGPQPKTAGCCAGWKCEDFVGVNGDGVNGDGVDGSVRGDDGGGEDGWEDDGDGTDGKGVTVGENDADLVDRGDGPEAKSDSSYLLLGLPIGFLCGLIGIGGGVIMVPVLSTAMGFGMHRAVGTSNAAIILTSSGGVLSYVFNGLGASGLPSFSLGYVNLLQMALLAGTSIPAACVGVRVAHRLQPHHLRAVFTVLMIYMGLRMMGAFELFHLPI